MIVTLDVPDNISFQFVYRMERRALCDVALEREFRFVFLHSLGDGLASFRELVSRFGRAFTLKGLLKLASTSRSMYAITQDREVLSYGWCTVGKCKYYRVESASVVIGPIWTSDSVRGKGLATKALQLAVNEYIRRGRSLFYIDTEKTNHPAQRVFEKCGFGKPVALYFR
jgi:ribosomal protein S18 acetylase RimI-like enzyme